MRNLLFCRANGPVESIMISQATLDDFRKKNPDLFGQTSKESRKSLSSDPGSGEIGVVSTKLKSKLSKSTVWFHH